MRASRRGQWGRCGPPLEMKRGRVREERREGVEVTWPGVFAANHSRPLHEHPQGVAAEENRHWHQTNPIDLRPGVSLGESEEERKRGGEGKSGSSLRNDGHGDRGEGHRHMKPGEESSLVSKINLWFDLHRHLLEGKVRERLRKWHLRAFLCFVGCSAALLAKKEDHQLLLCSP